MATVKNEEALHVASFVLDSYKRDIADFRAFSNQFNDEFTSMFESKVTGLKDLIEPVALTNALTNSTKILYGKLHTAADIMNRLEGFITFAEKKLNGKPGDFNLHAVRSHIHHKHVEGFTLSLSVTLDAITKNQAALEGAGMLKTFPKEITDLRDLIMGANLEQKHKLDERKELVSKNQNQINEVMTLVSFVNKFGKLIYKRNNPEKLQDYTLSELIYRTKKEEKTKIKV